ncbi:MarR family winged helix-turn-helix transcriptional regulator [Pseudooceanicola nitratireducens]|uniref:Transcriptional regulator, MarR family n=1 Tax=Pseudooceanicola nitratireducens TaxID=517719 RepID=A0A1I1J9U5_9RHOB|nr:MarR family transcriptional regulator [Pseudooceanicola nitratireducens]MEC7298982.1 MarR family transcriptional regulator [Pseudomonadota bacterium]SEJ28451.1 DNA-binding transcriptional regulator, MarR family [Pseudooceanicola nitratireducens]SFC42210.1 transcriptional regulator, MarR family [Pseudooceanicola nitratireducens]
MSRVQLVVDRSDEAELRLGQLAGSLGFLFRVGQLEVFDNFFDQLGKSGLKPGEFSVLWVVHLNPGVRQGAVAEKLRIKRAHMTKLVRSFEEDGLIERTIPEGDRRGIELRLTRSGSAFVEDHAQEFFDYAQSETDRLSPDEAAQLIALLQKFTGLTPGS